MSSDDSQANFELDWKRRAISFFEKLGRLDLWAGVIGNQALATHAAESQRNREAESQAYRQQMGAEVDPTSEDMGDVTLGDRISHYHQQPQSWLPILVAALLGLGAGIGGIAAVPLLADWLTADTPRPPVVTPADNVRAIETR